MQFKDYLKIMTMKEASDLYLSTGAPPTLKIEGKLVPIEKFAFKAGQIKEIAHAVMDDEQREDFAAKPEMNLALSEPGIGRFRVNIFKQRSELSMVVRNIKIEIPDTASLGIPESLKKVIMMKRGLVLFVGATGSGKSTSLASLIDYRNTHSADHIITIEDPIEFVHSHKRSIVNQREIGMDTDCYEDALKNALRQAPDVILIGEIRDRETMEHAIAFSETGHLAISTLHSNNASQAIDRIINFFPADRRNQLLMDLSLNLRAFVSQRLIATNDQKRVAIFEILLGTPRVQDLVSRGEIAELREVMEKSENLGMQSFDTALLKLQQAGQISLEEAMRNADSPNNIKVRASLLKGGTDNPETGALALIDDDRVTNDNVDVISDPGEIGLSQSA